MAFTRSLTYEPSKSAYWASQAMFADTVKTQQPAATLGCNRVVISFVRSTPAGTVEDRATIGLHMAKIVGGGLYSVLTAAEVTTSETAINAFSTSLQGTTHTSHTIAEYRWFEHRASHGAYADGSEVVGPPIKITTVTYLGTVAGSALPYQDGETISIRTASRKHWGRIYLPGLSTAHVDATGRYVTSYVDAVTTATRTLCTTLAAQSITVGVWTYRYMAFLDMTELRADNVPDIQRRRRPKAASYTKSFTS